MPETAALPLPDYTLGIVHGDAADEACLCLLDHRARVRAASSVRARGVPLRQQAIDSGRCDAIDDEGLDAIERLLADAVPPGAGFGVLAEAERVLYDEEVRAPMGIFPWSDPVLATLIALAMHPLGVRVVFAFYEVPGRAALVLHHAPDAPRAVDARQPRFLGRGLLGALTEQWLDAVPSSGRRAAAAASMARNPGLYAYWTCRGEPPSLGDVALYLRRGQQQMMVGSPDADFSMRVRPPAAQLDEIALDYAECRDRHAALGENDAHKVALIELCRRHRFDLRTIARHRPDIDAIDPRRVWPWPDDDRWVAEGLATSA